MTRLNRVLVDGGRYVYAYVDLPESSPASRPHSPKLAALAGHEDYHISLDRHRRRAAASGRRHADSGNERCVHRRRHPAPKHGISGLRWREPFAQLGWRGFPPATKSFVLIVFDPDAPTGSGFYHSIVANIPASLTSLAENAWDGGLPPGAVQGMTDYGLSQYGGPCPPRGDTPHHYRFTIYALDVATIPGADAMITGARLVFSMRGHLLAQGTLEGRFGL